MARKAFCPHILFVLYLKEVNLSLGELADPISSRSQSPVDQPERYPYQPALDGIRALAVTGVLLFHFGVDQVKGGFLGVDVFLVLSGFLITTLLLREGITNKRINIVAFYGRRVRRLLPCLLLVMIAVIFFGRYVADQLQLEELQGDAISSVFYFANWRFISSGGGYFEQFGSLSPLRHLWSLAIEEQWYLIWPLVVVGLLKLVGLPSGCRRWVWAVVTSTGALISVLLMVLLVNDANTNRVYYGSDTRVQALLIGTTLAVLFYGRAFTNQAQRFLDMAGLLGLLGCLVMFWRVDEGDTWMFRGGFALVAVLSAMLIAGAAGSATGFTQRLLTVPPLPALGRISYGVYLWHWPVFVYLDSYRTGLSGNSLFVLRCIITLLLAIASYELIERPIRQRTWSSWRGALITMSSVAVIATMVLVLIPFKNSKFEAVNLNIGIPKTLPSGPRMMVAGNSVALTLASGYQKNLLSRPVKLADVSLSGCDLPFPRFIKCQTVFNRWRAGIEKFDPDITIVMGGRWLIEDRIINARAYRAGTKKLARLLLKTLKQGLQILTARGATVLLLTFPSCRPSVTAQDYPPSTAKWLNGLFKKAAQSQGPLVKVIDFDAFFCPDGGATIRGTVETVDGAHLTKAGAADTWKWLEGQLVLGERSIT